jgi:REP-associated tyrosine transposase
LPFLSRALPRGHRIPSVRFERRNIRLPPVNYRGQGLFFITLCCERRRPVFADGLKARWIIDSMRAEAVAQQFGLHAYCVMPDHLHALVEGLSAGSDLLRFVKLLKLKTARVRRRGSAEGLWQKKFYDHILRRTETVDAVAWYIWMNPVRARLASRPQDYPYSGSATVDWKRASSSAAHWEPPWKKKRSV